MAVPVSADDTQTIKKCQDAEGKWHYGDHASFECEKGSSITEMNEGGVEVGKIEAPPTTEELKAAHQAREKESERDAEKAAQQRLDQRLLVTYDNPESILRTRDALLAAMDSAIAADRLLRDRLVGELDRIQANPSEDARANAESLRRQIEDFDRAIRSRLQKREIAKKKYETDHKRYVELTGN